MVVIFSAFIFEIILLSRIGTASARPRLITFMMPFIVSDPTFGGGQKFKNPTKLMVLFWILCGVIMLAAVAIGLIVLNDNGVRILEKLGVVWSLVVLGLVLILRRVKKNPLPQTPSEENEHDGNEG